MSRVDLERLSLRQLEAVAITSTVLAFALTLLLVGGTPLEESNAVAVELVAVLGWGGAGLLAVVGEGAIFAIYRRIRPHFPHSATVGALVVVAIGVGDLLWNVRGLLQVGLPETVAWWVVLEPAVPVAIVGALVIARPSTSPLRELVAAAPRPPTPSGRVVGIVGISLILVLSPVVPWLGAPFAQIGPVGTTEAATGPDGVWAGGDSGNLVHITPSGTIDKDFDVTSERITAVKASNNNIFLTSGGSLYKLDYQGNTIWNVNVVEGSSNADSVELTDSHVYVGHNGNVSKYHFNGSEVYTSTLESGGSTTTLARDKADPSEMYASIRGSGTYAFSRADGGVTSSNTPGTMVNGGVSDANGDLWTGVDATNHAYLRYPDGTGSYSTYGGSAPFGKSAGANGTTVYIGDHLGYVKSHHDGWRVQVSPNGEPVKDLAHTGENTLYASHGNITKLDDAGNILWTKDTGDYTRTIAEAKGFGTGGSATSKINATVTNQAGQPISNATVVGYAALWSDKTTEQASSTLSSYSNPTPDAWRDVADDPDLTSSDGIWSSEKTDSYVSTHAGDVVPRTSPWLDSADLDGTAALDLPANEKIVVAAWDATADGFGTNSCVPGFGSEYDCQMPGEHKGSDTEIVVERITASGEVVQEDVIQPSKTSGGGFGDPDSFAYAEIQLPPGFYYLHEKGAPRGVPRKVGDLSGIIDRYQETTEGQLTNSAANVESAISATNVTRVVAETDKNGEATLQVPASAKVVSVQAMHAPGLELNATNISQSRIVTEYNRALELSATDRSDAQARLVNSSVYFPSDVKQVQPPGETTVRLYELSSPPGANITALQGQIAELESLIQNATLSDLPSSVQQRLEETATEDLRATYSELVGIIKQYPPAEDRYLELTDRDSIASPSELSKSELRSEINLLNRALYSTDLTGSLEEAEVDKTAENVSLAWGVPDMDLSEANVSVIAHFSNGTSRPVPAEYISVDTSAFGSDTVRLEKYPLGETDPKAVQFTLRVAGGDELRERSRTVTNPTKSGEMPRVDSISVSSLTPGPNENVSVRVNPSAVGSFKRLENVTAYGPDGNTVATSSITEGTAFNFNTDGAGIYRLELTVATTGGEQMVLPVRLKAYETDLPRPPSITVRDSPLGVYALAGDGLEGASVSMDNGGADTTVVAKLAEGGSAPSEVDVHLEELSIPGEAETTVTLVRGSDEQQVRKHVPVTVHLRKPTSDVLVRRNGKPVTVEGTKYGRAYQTSNSLVVDTYTGGDGTVTVKKTNNPTSLEKLRYRLDVFTSGLSIPLLSTAPAGEVGA